MGIQRQMLKKFKDKKGLIENVGLSRSTVYFKIGLLQTFKKVFSSKEHKFINEIILNSLTLFALCYLGRLYHFRAGGGW